jgi:hypothetical protein
MEDLVVASLDSVSDIEEFFQLNFIVFLLGGL